MKKWFIEETVISDVADTIAAFVAPDSVRIDPDHENEDIFVHSTDVTIPIHAMHGLVDVVLERDGTTHTALIGKSLLIALAHTARIDRRFQWKFIIETETSRSVRLSLLVREHTYMTRAKAKNIDIDDGFGPALIVAESCAIVIDDGASKTIIPIPKAIGFGVVIVPEDMLDDASLRFDSLLSMRLVVHPARYPRQPFDEFLVEAYYAARMALLSAMSDAHAAFDWDDESGDDVLVEEDAALAMLRYVLPLHLPFIFHACAQLERPIMVHAEDRQGMTNVLRALRAAGATRILLDDDQSYGVFDDGTNVRLIIV